MNKKFEHGSLNLVQKSPIIFTSYSKRNFYLRSNVSQFVLLQGGTPINAFLNFDYNLAGLVSKDIIRTANNTMIKRSDALWVFGEISDGVLMEIYMAKQQSKSVRYFTLTSDGTTFREVSQEDVRLEDVSSWMWEWLQAGRDLERWHPRLRFKKTFPLIYPAYSKHNFFLQMQISQFCLEHHKVPLNPFMLFRYFLGDSVPRDTVYRANNNIVRICDEIWAFGEVSDGVLAEIKLKRDQGHPVKYFKWIDSNPITFRKATPKQMVFEEAILEDYRYILK